MICHKNKLKLIIYIQYICINRISARMFIILTSNCCILLIDPTKTIIKDNERTSITIVIQIQIQADSVVSDTNGLLISWFRFMATRGERHNSYYADTHPNVRCILWCLKSQFISINRDPKNPTTTLNGRNPTLASLVQSQLMSSQNTQILRTIFSGHDVLQTSAPFPVWGFIMINNDCHILCARA